MKREHGQALFSGPCAVAWAQLNCRGSWEIHASPVPGEGNRCWDLVSMSRGLLFAGIVGAVQRTPLREFTHEVSSIILKENRSS